MKTITPEVAAKLRSRSYTPPKLPQQNKKSECGPLFKATRQEALEMADKLLTQMGGPEWTYKIASISETPPYDFYVNIFHQKGKLQICPGVDGQWVCHSRPREEPTINEFRDTPLKAVKAYLSITAKELKNRNREFVKTCEALQMEDRVSYLSSPPSPF